MNISIFLSYAREDVRACDCVFEFFEQLRLPVFRDVDGLYGAENWREEILEKAQSSTFFVFLASGNSIDKPGLIQDELEVARSKLEHDTAFKFLAVRLDEATLKPWMSDWQYVEFSDDRIWEMIANAINDHINSDKGPIDAIGKGVFVNRDPLRISYATEACTYDYAIPSIVITGEKYLSREINQLIHGRVSERLLRMRGWVEDGQRGPKMHGSEISLNLIDAEISANFVSFYFEHFAYFDRAAHPQHGFVALNIQRTPWALFQPRLSAENLNRFVDLVVEEVEKIEGVWGRDELVESLRCFNWSEHIVLSKSGAKLLFPDYTIGPYVFGACIHETTNNEILRLISSDE